MSGALFDFGMYCFHNAYALMERNTGPYFYVAKLESHLEARLWNNVFVMAQRLMGVPIGTIRYIKPYRCLSLLFMKHVHLQTKILEGNIHCSLMQLLFKLRNDFL